MEKVFNRKHAILTSTLVVILSAMIIVGCQKETTQQPVAERDTYSAAALFRGIIMASGEVADHIPAYKELKALNGMAKGVTQRERTAAEDILIARIEQLSPGYLEVFKKEVLSKDPVRVEAALLEAGNLLTKAIWLQQSTTGVDQKKIERLISSVRNQKQQVFDQYIADIRDGKLNREQMIAQGKQLFGEEISVLFAGTEANAKIDPQYQQTCGFINVAIVANFALAVNAAAAVNLAIYSYAAVTENVMMFRESDPMDHSNNSRLKSEQFVQSLITHLP
ncbi:hypothetical protein KTO58_18430 [Chitinophaga pendula]|uniref:hypothetical protein n=1 Tax=Chitinophaga TaxID=79328 RepID=UPI000BAEB63C|nr:MULTISPECIES: hypothetical protein [Chitinophaga]ASZ11345.1 hypothetical protein CK934_10385 [Chitinophaga sp. MD30]UCJ05653.1 hypothetical protein KTO58_18430 [Chitinophaga pendula]